MAYRDVVCWTGGCGGERKRWWVWVKALGGVDALASHVDSGEHDGR
jgi:hypothetical protein